jgi:hypothetical protein
MSDQAGEPLQKHGLKEYFWFAAMLVVALICSAMEKPESTRTAEDLPPTSTLSNAADHE